MYETALITGGTKGIGLAIAEEIAPLHKKVCLIYSSDDIAAEKAKDQIEKKGVPVHLYCYNLSNVDGLTDLVSEISLKIGHVSTLINNAGAIIRPAEWNKQATKNFRLTMDINFTSCAELIRLLAPQMVEKSFGRIINIASSYSFKGAAAVLAYTCAKSALITLTKAMANELGDQGVTVNCIAPGNIDTDMTQSAGSDLIDWVLSTTPVGRLGKPCEIGKAARYLIESEFVTGIIHTVDGGQTLRI